MEGTPKNRLYPPLPASRRDELLAESHFAILSVSRLQGGPVAVPVGYVCRNGKFFLETFADGLHGSHMRRTGHATLTVQAEEEPYHYYSADCTVQFLNDDDLATLGESYHGLALEIANRYMPPDVADRFVRELLPAMGEVRMVLLTPETVWAAVIPTHQEEFAALAKRRSPA